METEAGEARERRRAGILKEVSGRMIYENRARDLIAKASADCQPLLLLEAYAVAQQLALPQTPSEPNVMQVHRQEKPTRFFDAHPPCAPALLALSIPDHAFSISFSQRIFIPPFPGCGVLG